MRNARVANVWGWLVLVTFFAVFFIACKDRFHTVYPGYYIVTSFAASLLMIVAMWRIYVGTVAPPPAATASPIRFPDA